MTEPLANGTRVEVQGFRGVRLGAPCRIVSCYQRGPIVVTLDDGTIVHVCRPHWRQVCAQRRAEGRAPIPLGSRSNRP